MAGGKDWIRIKVISMGAAETGKVKQTCIQLLVFGAFSIIFVVPRRAVLSSATARKGLCPRTWQPWE